MLLALCYSLPQTLRMLQNSTLPPGFTGNGNYYIHSVAVGGTCLVVDVDVFSDEDLDIHYCDNSTSQTWNIFEVSPGNFQLLNQGLGECAEAHDGVLESDFQVSAEDCDAQTSVSADQLWNFNVVNGAMYIQSAQTHYCLTVDLIGDDTYQKPCGDFNDIYAQWYLQQAF